MALDIEAWQPMKALAFLICICFERFLPVHLLYHIDIWFKIDSGHVALILMIHI